MWTNVFFSISLPSRPCRIHLNSHTKIILFFCLSNSYYAKLEGRERDVHGGHESDFGLLRWEHQSRRVEVARSVKREVGRVRLKLRLNDS